MKILAAIPDRDMLACTKALVSGWGYEVFCVFDAPQLILVLSNEKADAVILDTSLPLTDIKKLLKFIHGKDIPVLALTDKKTEYDHLFLPDHADSYLVYPFMPSELETRLCDMITKYSEEKTVNGIDIKKLSLKNSRITNEEAELLYAAYEKRKPGLKHTERYRMSLNAKLLAEDAGFYIKYILGEGYRMVSVYE